jgi:hypothetical protein
LGLISNTVASIVVNAVCRTPVVWRVIPVVGTILPIIRRVIPVVGRIVPIVWRVIPIVHLRDAGIGKKEANQKTKKSFEIFHIDLQ